MPGQGLPAVVLLEGENPPNPDSIGGFVYKSLQRGEIRALNGGADSWWQNVKIDRDMLDGKQSELDAWKLAAQQNTERVYRVPDTELFMAAAGRRHHPYLLVSPGVGELEVSYSPIVEWRGVRVRLYSGWLAGRGAVEIEAASLALAEQVFGVGCVISQQVSEVHVAVDVAGWVPMLADVQKERYVCPARFNASSGGVEWRSGVIQSGYWGKRGASSLQVAVYDKGREIVEHSPEKAYLLETWARRGWSEECGPVYRIEGRFTREWLRDRNIERAADVDLSALMLAALSWLELRDEDPTDSNRARWSVAPAWEQIRAQALAMLGEQQLQYEKVHQPRVSVDRLAAQALGCLAGIGALTGVDDLADLLAFLGVFGPQQLERRGLEFMGQVAQRRDRYMLPVMAA